jgi:integrase
MARIGTKPNGIYFLDVHVEVEGKLKRQRVSCDTRDKADAEHQRRAWIAGVHSKHPAMGGDVAPKGRVSRLLTSSNAPVRVTGWTLERVLDRCLKDPEVWGRAKAQMTLRSNARLIGQREIGQTPVTEITHPMLKKLVADMEREGKAPATIRRHLASISRALEMATEWEDENGKPILHTKPKLPTIIVHNLKDRILEPREERLVFEAIDAREIAQPNRPWARFRMFLRVALDTGFRKGELLILGPHSVIQLQKNGVDHLFLSLPRYDTKTNKPRVVPCSAAVARLIPALNAQAPNGLWFPLGQGAWLMWDRIREDVKAMGGDIDEVGIHTLRHTCLTRLARGGMELQRLSMWAGHSDVSITARRYVHLDASALLGGVELLGATPAQDGKQDADPELSFFSNPSVDRGNRAECGTVTVQ